MVAMKKKPRKQTTKTIRATGRKRAMSDKKSFKDAAKANENPDIPKRVGHGGAEDDDADDGRLSHEGPIPGQRPGEHVVPGQATHAAPKTPTAHGTGGAQRTPGGQQVVRVGVDEKITLEVEDSATAGGVKRYTLTVSKEGVARLEAQPSEPAEPPPVQSPGSKSVR
jgi:hypothetical protein